MHVAWSEGWNWTKEELLEGVCGQNRVYLDYHLDSYDTALVLAKWLEEAGYTVTINKNNKIVEALDER